MSMEEALSFCRRRLDTALERSGDLYHAASVLRDDDEEAERIWVDSLALELRRRDLEPHRGAASRQWASLNGAIESGKALLVALEEAGRAEAAVLRAVTAARGAIQASLAATAEAQQAIDTAQVSIQTAESEWTAARDLLRGL
jgi:hypothetical protein